MEITKQTEPEWNVLGIAQDTQRQIPREAELQKGIKMEFTELAFKAFGKCIFLASL